MPQLWIVAGPNGAGKTTVADRWLSPRIPVVSPDALAAEEGLSPIQAGRAAVAEQERLLAANESFALDTTLSGNRELALMKRAAEAGYKVNLIFVCVESLALCQARILERTESGRYQPWWASSGLVVVASQAAKEFWPACMAPDWSSRRSKAEPSWRVRLGTKRA